MEPPEVRRRGVRSFFAPTPAFSVGGVGSFFLGSFYLGEDNVTTVMGVVRPGVTPSSFWGFVIKYFLSYLIEVQRRA